MSLLEGRWLGVWSLNKHKESAGLEEWLVFHELAGQLVVAEQ